MGDPSRTSSPRARADYDPATLRKWDASSDPVDVSGGGGVGAPANAKYVVLEANAELTQEQVLAVGAGLKLATATLTGTSTTFITNVMPTGSGTVTEKVYEADTDPADKVLLSCEADTDDITVHVEVDGGPDGWQPTVTIQGGTSPVVVTNLTRLGDYSRRFSGSAAIEATGNTTLYASCADGEVSQNVSHVRGLDPPEVLTAIVDTHPLTTGGDSKCPGEQTQVHGVNDSENNPQYIRLTGTTQSHATHVYVKSYGATDGYGLQGPFAVTAEAFDCNVYIGSSSSGAEACRLYAVAGLGTTPGPDFDTTNTVDCSHTLATFGSASIDYPALREALKDDEDAEVTLSCTNWDASDDALYSSNGTGELEISNTENGVEDLTTYQAAKWAERQSGNYRETGDNYKLTVTRSGRNGTINSSTTCVRIAHVAPVITVQTYSSLDGLDKRLRSDDGSNGYYDHQIRLKADQARLGNDTPEIQGPPVGTFQGLWSQYSTTEYRRNLRISDSDFVSGGQAANNYSWNDSTTVSWVNRAGKETTTVTTGASFSIGGFDERTLTIAAWPNRTADIGCLVVDTTELVCENLSKGGEGPNGGTIFTFDNSPGDGETPDDETDKFCIVDGSDLVDDDHQNWYNKDFLNAESNTTGTAQVLIEEEA